MSLQKTTRQIYNAAMDRHNTHCWACETALNALHGGIWACKGGSDPSERLRQAEIAWSKLSMEELETEVLV